MSKLCPMCQQKDKADGQSYCKDCRNEYAKLTRAKKLTEAEKILASIKQIQATVDNIEKSTDISNRLDFIEESLEKIMKHLKL